MFFVDQLELSNFMSDSEVREEYEYVMTVADMAKFMLKYGQDKVMNDINNCAAALLSPRNYGSDVE